MYIALANFLMCKAYKYIDINQHMLRKVQCKAHISCTLSQNKQETYPSRRNTFRYLYETEDNWTDKNLNTISTHQLYMLLHVWQDMCKYQTSSHTKGGLIWSSHVTTCRLGMWCEQINHVDITEKLRDM